MVWLSAIVVGSGQGAVLTLEMVRKLKEHGKLNLVKGVFFPGGPTDLARAGLTGADFDHVPFLVVNGDYGGFAPWSLSSPGSGVELCSP